MPDNTTKTKERKLYKYLRTGLKSDRGNTKWKIEKWKKVRGKPSICNKGFHASQKPLQALQYVGGEILAEVMVRGDSVIQDDKECWSEMKIVRAWHWTKKDSVELAIFSAEQVIDIFEKEYPKDKQPREAIESAKQYLKTGKSGGNDAAYAAYTAYAIYAVYSANAANAAAAAYAAYATAATAATYYVDDYAYHVTKAASAASAPDKKEFTKKLNAWYTRKIKKLTPYD